mmetsp:Transcript_15941/g.24654  ORF Transcript_15941/g.24654 Transcript_15941/m.24654 type:complete len:102 (+) Transcript_15941:1046-1351(+)
MTAYGLTYNLLVAQNVNLNASLLDLARSNHYGLLPLPIVLMKALGGALVGGPVVVCEILLEELLDIFKGPQLKELKSFHLPLPYIIDIDLLSEQKSTSGSL